MNPVNAMSKEEHRSPVPATRPSFLKRFRLEILSLLLLGTGLFLLVEKLEIKHILYEQGIWLLSILQNVTSALAGTISRIQRSDIAGLVLIALSVWIMGARIRFLMIQRHPGVDVDFPCPKCNTDLKRTHRTAIHRILQTVFRVRITHCTCRKCQFAATVWARKEV